MKKHLLSAALCLASVHATADTPESYALCVAYDQAVIGIFNQAITNGIVDTIAMRSVYQEKQRMQQEGGIALARLYTLTSTDRARELIVEQKGKLVQSIDGFIGDGISSEAKMWSVVDYLEMHYGHRCFYLIGKEFHNEETGS